MTRPPGYASGECDYGYWWTRDLVLDVPVLIRNVGPEGPEEVKIVVVDATELRPFNPEEEECPGT